MADQRYENHRHRATAWLVTWAGGAVATGLLFWEAWQQRTLTAIALLVLSLVVLGTITILRTTALRLQDRIIRLEMRVRLARLGREAAADRLSVKQLVALRFASDAELPALIERALAESLSPDQIKRSVKDWQADFFRT